MRTREGPPCSGQSFHDRVGFVGCANRGNVMRDGEWYCGVHDPVKVAARRKALRDAFEAESARSKAASDDASRVARRMAKALGVPVHVRYGYHGGRTRVEGVSLSIEAALNYLDGRT